MSLVELLVSTQDLERCRSLVFDITYDVARDYVCFYMLCNFSTFSIFAIELLTRLNLCRYCPVRRTITCGGGTPYQQFLVSQRRYAVYLQCSKYHKMSNCTTPDALLNLGMHQNLFSAGAVLWTPLGVGQLWVQQRFLALLTVPAVLLLQINLWLSRCRVFSRPYY